MKEIIALLVSLLPTLACEGFSDRRFTENQKEYIIEALFKRIMSFDQEWSEQEICLTYIKERRCV